MIMEQKPKKVWSLNQLKIGQLLIGIPNAEYWENKKGNKFIKLGLDYGHAICSIFFLLFDFPKQKILNNKLHNSFELVRFYREANDIPVDDNITQLHDTDWQEIIDWLNDLRTLKIQVISKNMNGFKNIKFRAFSDARLSSEVGFQKWIL